MRPGSILRGRVVDDQGAIVPGVEVVCARLGASQLGDIRLAKRRYRTAEDGTFSTQTLAPGLWECSVATETHITVEPFKIDLAPVDAGTESIELVASRAASARGTVVDPQGEPVAGASVSLEIDGSNWQIPLTGQPGPEPTVSDDDGSFLLLGLPPGTAALKATQDGLAPGATDPLTLEPGEQIQGLTIALTQGGRSRGSVSTVMGNRQPID